MINCLLQYPKTTLTVKYLRNKRLESFLPTFHFTIIFLCTYLVIVLPLYSTINYHNLFKRRSINKSSYLCTEFHGNNFTYIFIAKN